MMKKIALILSGLIVLAAIPMLARAADEAKALTGEPIDITCYMMGKSGEGHAGCASACVTKKGLPAGLLVKEGDKAQVYLVLGDSKKVGEMLGPLMGKQAKVTGKVGSKDGIMTIEATAAEAAK